MTHPSPANVSFNKKLVRSVEKHPNIYNYELQEYSSRANKQKSWAIIAAEVGANVVQCKEKWRNLRISYSDYLRKYPNDTEDEFLDRNYLTDIMKFLRPFIRTRGNFNRTLPFTEENSSVPADFLKIMHPKSEYLDDTEIIISDDEQFDCEPMASKYLETVQKEELNISSSDQVEIQNSYNSSEQLPDLIKMKPSYAETIGPGNTILLNTNPRHQFLMSILPDLEKMNDRQMRKFRAKVSTSIEEILEDE